MSQQRQGSRVDEEEDLDDLDDVLDQFDQSAQSASANANANASASMPAQPADKATAHAPPSSGDDFEVELAKQMESLFESLGIDSGAGVGSRSEGASAGADGPGVGSTTREQERERERQLAAAWETMLVEEMNAMNEPSVSPSASASQAGASSPGPAKADFQSRIRSSMNRLRESESGLRPPDSSPSADGDAFKSLLEGLGELGGDGEQDGDIQKMLEMMMGQLMSKDVLYEPLKELHEKFPGYLTEHTDISPEDKARFEAQIACIKRLIDEFEAPTYRDDDEKARERIVALMSELQTHGSPPEEIMGPLPPGFNMGADGLPEVPGDCNVH